MNDEELLRDDAIALLYQAGIDSAARRSGLAKLAQLLNAGGAFYLIWDRERNAVVDCESVGMVGPDFAALYRERWGALDPRRRFLERGAAESIFVADEDAARGELEGTEFATEFLASQGIAHSLGANLTDIGRVYRQIYVERAAGQVPFSAADVAEFRRLVRHMAKGERLVQSLEERVYEDDLPRQVLDGMSIGTIVTDASGQVRFANAAAEEILAENDGLSWRDRRIQAARSFETNNLLAAIREAAAGASPEKREGALLIARPSGRRSYAVVVMPLAAFGSAEAPAARALIFVTDLAHRNSELAPRLVQLFGLSKAEARVAAGIAEGRRLHEIAQEFDVQMPTVRTQLRAVLKKIGANRQADLVRIVLALPPMLSTTERR